jgi:hypothetical protein
MGATWRRGKRNYTVFTQRKSSRTMVTTSIVRSLGRMTSWNGLKPDLRYPYRAMLLTVVELYLGESASALNLSCVIVLQLYLVLLRIPDLACDSVARSSTTTVTMPFHHFDDNTQQPVTIQ